MNTFLLRNYSSVERRLKVARPFKAGRAASLHSSRRCATRRGCGYSYPGLKPPATINRPSGTNRYCNLTLFLSLSLFVFLSPLPLVLAGHGFSSAFGNIEWLPEPGRTPDNVWYRLDAVQEESQLLLSRTTSDKLRLCLTFAREKLAELEAMTKAENTTAATTAVERYRAYVDRVKDLVANETTDKEVLVEQFATVLLEHQYIVSVIYPELPAGTRAVVLQVATIARDHYQEIAKLLPQKKKGALFFKEEEVRWSMEMATREEEKPPE